MDIAYKTFKPNKRNVLSQIVDRFLERQVYLNGVVHITPILKKTPIHLSALHSIRGGDDGISVIHHTSFEVSPVNRDEFFNDFENYLLMNVIAQSVENFESFLKRIINEPILKMKDGGNDLRDNKKRIKILKDTFQRVASYLKQTKYKELLTVFLLVENIRHRTVHAQMIIENATKINIKSPEFRSYFGTKSANGLIVATISEERSHELLDKLSQLAYIIFKGLSEEFSLPITETPTFLPPIEVIREMIAQNKIR